MKKSVFGASLSLCLFLAAGSAHASCNTKGCGDEKVKRLYPNISGIVYVEVTGDKSPLDCTLVADKYMTFDMSAVGAEAIYSMLLTALTTDRPLEYIRISNGSSNCSVRYVQLSD